MKALTKKQLGEIYLPKWPGLFVSGKHISAEQAAEVIIRTDCIFSYMSCNDCKWIETIAKICGLEYEKEYPHIDYDELRIVAQQIGHIPLDYLHNERVNSCYIGGPHGWCNWDGEILCNSYNIGKWPHVEEVLREWQEIAKAFPFLELKSQQHIAISQGENGE